MKEAFDWAGTHVVWENLIDGLQDKLKIFSDEVICH